MNYQIMEQVAGKKFVPALNPKTDEPLVFDCPHKAAQEAAQLTALKGVKFQPRPMAEMAADTWKFREAKRFTDGSYKPVVWVGQKWWDDHRNTDHFVHVSLKDPTKIAFTKNARDGSKDIQTAMKPGKYLAEFFSQILSTEEIKTFAMQHSMTFENKELKFATTPEEIERVYAKEGLGSCFSGTKKANLYGSGDFAVAYIETDGDIKARAVCCPERKIHTYAYGDRCRLLKLLTDAGYKDGGYGGTAWSGLRLLKEHHWDGFYNDFGKRTKPHPTDDKYLVIV